MNVTESIHRILDAHARLGAPAASLAQDADLYAAGMTSHASVNVMLALEDAFEIEFPDALLTKLTFCTVANIHSAIASVREVAA
jgi:acyl carrier protein